MFADKHDGEKTLEKTRRNWGDNIVLSFKEMFCENVRGCGSEVRCNNKGYRRQEYLMAYCVKLRKLNEVIHYARRTKFILLLFSSLLYM